MEVELIVKSIDVRGTEEDPRGNHRTAVTVHFEVQSDLGRHQIAVPADDFGIDNAVSNARKRVAAWAAALAREAQQM